MKRRILIFLSIIAIAGFISSCKGSEDCPAYDRVDTRVEQAK